MTAINARLQQADWMGAAVLAEAALDAGDQGPMLLKLRALNRQQAGQWVLAAADIEAALAQWPQDFSAWNMLGFCQARAGQPEQAAASLEKAIQLSPDFAAAWVNRGWTLEMMGELNAARAAYERAMALDPDDVRPASNLALMAARARDWSRAEALGRTVLSREPGQPAALVALATADLGQDRPAEALDRLKTLVALPNQDAHQKAAAQGLIGDALDRLGRPDEAYAAYAAANAAFADLYAPGLDERETGVQRARRLTKAFEALRAWPLAAQTAANAGPAISGHVFLLGFPRSGTTLLGQVLDAHPAITTLDERETLAAAAAAYLDAPGGLERLATATEAELEPVRAAYWERVARAGLNLEGQVFVDKLPLNTLGLPLIGRLFPAAKVVFMRRDPRDVVLSCFRQRFVIGPSTAQFLTLEGAARFFDAVMTLADAYRAGLPDLPLRIQPYEALVDDFEGQTRAILDFVGLPWDAAVAGFADRAADAAVATPSAGQIARGLNREGVGAWRRYAASLAEVQPILAPWIARFGYPPE
jgi:Flp pilus assembly protein TadD